MLKMMLTVTLVAVFSVFGFSLWAAQPDLAAADWSVKSPRSLATVSPSDDAVLGFVEKLEGLDHLILCSFRFGDLRHSGNLSLVVSTSDGRFCNVEIIDKTASGFELYDADSSRDSGIKLEDIDGSGSLELIADVDLTSYQGASRCVATWPVIYAWTGSGYTDVSNQYRGYYEQYLESLKKKIAQISSATEQAQATTTNQTGESEPTSIRHFKAASRNGTTSITIKLPPPEESIVPEGSPSAAATPGAVIGVDPCMEAEAAKIERFLGISRDAGMSDAIKWANSDDHSTREFAVDILSDIGTPDAILYLRTLSKDSDRAVAHFAKSALTNIAQPVVHTVDRVDLAESPQR